MDSLLSLCRQRMRDSSPPWRTAARTEVCPPGRLTSSAATCLAAGQLEYPCRQQTRCQTVPHLSNTISIISMLEYSCLDTRGPHHGDTPADSPRHPRTPLQTSAWAGQLLQTRWSPDPRLHGGDPGVCRPPPPPWSPTHLHTPPPTQCPASTICSSGSILRTFLAHLF